MNDQLRDAENRGVNPYARATASTPTRDPIAWVNTGQRVEARYANAPGVHAAGKVVAYLGEPSVTIKTDSGEYVHWAASITHPVEECGEVTDALRHPARCVKPKDHYGERHTADLGVGTFTWGYLPNPEEVPNG